MGQLFSATAENIPLCLITLQVYNNNKKKIIKKYRNKNEKKKLIEIEKKMQSRDQSRVVAAADVAG